MSRVSLRYLKSGFRNLKGCLMTLDAFLKIIKGTLVVLIVPSSILRDPSRDIKVILVDWMHCLWIPKDPIVSLFSVGH